MKPGSKYLIAAMIGAGAGGTGTNEYNSAEVERLETENAQLAQVQEFVDKTNIYNPTLDGYLEQSVRSTVGKADSKTHANRAYQIRRLVRIMQDNGARGNVPIKDLSRELAKYVQSDDPGWINFYNLEFSPNLQEQLSLGMGLGNVPDAEISVLYVLGKFEQEALRINPEAVSYSAPAKGDKKGLPPEYYIMPEHAPGNPSPEFPEG